jgi:two-component SAPR family response regulator
LAQLLPNDPFIKKVLEEVSEPGGSGPTIQVTDKHRVRVQTLGTFRVFRGDQEIVDWSSVKARDMLGYFVTFRHEHIPLDRALHDLWPGDERRGKTTFHTALYRLRQALRQADENTKFIIVEVGDYRLDLARFEIDVEQFDFCLSKAKQTRGGSEAVTWLEKVIDLYAGNYLDNLYYDWAQPERQRLEEAYIYTLKSLYAAHAQQSDLESAIATARRLLTIDPLLEDVHCDVMRYLHQIGDRKRIAEQYAQLEAALRQAFEIEPMPSTRRLYDRLLQ